MTTAQRVEGALMRGPHAGLTDAELEARASLKRDELQAIEEAISARVQDVQRDLAAIEAEQQRRQDIKRLEARLEALRTGKDEDNLTESGPSGLLSGIAYQVRKESMLGALKQAHRDKGYIQPVIVAPPGAGIGGPR